MNIKRNGSAMVHKATETPSGRLVALCMGIRASQAVPTTEPVNCGGCIAEGAFK